MNSVELTETGAPAEQQWDEEPLLHVEGVSMSFGGVQALTDVSFAVGEGTIAGLIGSNGAGKSTLFNCVSGIYRPDTGRIRFAGRDILGSRVSARSGLGISRTFQNVALFEHLNVVDNVLVGGHSRGRVGFLRAGFHLPGSIRAERQMRQEALEILADLSLESVAHDDVTTLPYGTRKRVELARALMGRPRLLMLDEPAAGLPHGEVDALAGEIRRINEEFGITVILVEHHMGMVMTVCHRIVVLDHGLVLAMGTPQEVQEDRNVVEAYLGG
ncbi:ABC transporter ATP-binding protein [Pseudonocardia hispaniensis]|uniref:ABC transporter ATP-binding protein n=1 Tax=Pseudonocardia hispaniensis TaxID=904933 RepID=A0ABW1J0Y9_9PSEU